jgi:hypothetical protein
LQIAFHYLFIGCSISNGYLLSSYDDPDRTTSAP